MDTRTTVKGHLNKLNLKQFSWFSLLVNLYSSVMPAQQGPLRAWESFHQNISPGRSWMGDAAVLVEMGCAAFACDTWRWRSSAGRMGSPHGSSGSRAAAPCEKCAASAIYAGFFHQT